MYDARRRFTPLCRDDARPWLQRATLSAILLSALSAPPATAAIVTWDGDGPTNAWSSVGTPPAGLGNSNWVGNFVIPANGDDLVFAGTRSLVNSNNYLTSVGRVTFDATAGAFVLGGSSLTVRGEITNSSDNLQTFSMALTLGRKPVPEGYVLVDGGQGGLRIDGALSVEDGTQLSLQRDIRIENPNRSLVLGNAGSVYVIFERGATVNSRTVRLGDQRGGYGNVQFDQTGASLTTLEEIVIGNEGVGEFRLTNGAVSRNGSARIAAREGSVGEAQIRSEWHVTRGLSVGQLGSGTMRILGNGAVFSDEGSIGADDGAGGSVEVGGASRWEVSTRLMVGATSGTGTLDVLTGGLVSAQSLTINSRGIVRLAGGELTFETFSSTGRLEWTSGTLSLRGPAGAALGAGPLPGVLNLASNMHLRVDETFTVGAGRVLVLNGGSVSAGGLTLSGGTIVAPTGFDPSHTGGLSGHGVVVGPVTGGAGSRIRADGTLTLGDAAAIGGFDFDGELDAGHNQVVLLASGNAGLGVRTSLGAGSRLNVPNGAFLDRGRTLNSTATPPFSAPSSMRAA